MENPIYRIKVEVIGQERTAIDQQLKDGLECEGFALILDEGKTKGTALHGISINDMVSAIVGNECMMQAALIARGYNEAKAYKRQREIDAAQYARIKGVGKLMIRLLDDGDGDAGSLEEDAAE